MGIQARSLPGCGGHSSRGVFALLGLLALLGSLAACGPGAIGTAAAEGPRLAFQQTSHDFGQISYSQPLEYRFPFTNTGNRPLNIGELRPEPPGPGG